VDIVVAVVETHGREETQEMIGDLERVAMRRIEYRGVTLEEMDVEAVIARRPAIAIVDELAHTNVPGSKNRKRYEDVIDLLNAGISVITAVNIQHLESLNDAVASTTGVRVRETIPDYFLRRADEVVNVDVSVDTLRTRLRQGKIYGIEKIEQSLNNFFRKGNLSALRELSLRQVAADQATKAHDYREREGLGQAVIPEKVLTRNDVVPPIRARWVETLRGTRRAFVWRRVCVLFGVSGRYLLLPVLLPDFFLRVRPVLRSLLRV
jgi:two-component system sensor histidine kinase KdpD